jgi:hypothetical protein
MPLLSLPDHKIIQIGGGNTIGNSQGQIEDNVIWLSEILKRSSNDVVNFFAAGNGNVKDVSLFSTGELDPIMEPLTRVFGNSDASRLMFKSNQVPNLTGSTRKGEITKALEAVLSELDSNTDLLLIYNGHGGYNKNDFRLNDLKIWLDDRLNVAEMDSIFDMAPQDATIRFIFPQCYSGGFYYLIYQDPLSDRIASQNRCGFFSESPQQESEGCSLDTNKEEYRDYSTYYFAPLNNATRRGKPLSVSPDLNGDGAVSFRESHLYTLKVGMSKDLSRSTSEVYLEEWEPWYVRWGIEENRKSIYWEVAEYIAQTRNLSMDGRELASLKRALQQEIASTVHEQRNHEKEIARLRNKIKKVVEHDWPELQHPYTTAYLKLINNEADQISQEIRKMSQYESLADLQKDLNELTAKELKLERDKAQIDKIVRMKKLARLEKLFFKYAEKDEIQVYQRLLDCESGTFFKQEMP